jgi:hypothetical protein
VAPQAGCVAPGAELPKTLITGLPASFHAVAQRFARPDIDQQLGSTGLAIPLRLRKSLDLALMVSDRVANSPV